MSKYSVKYQGRWADIVMGRPDVKDQVMLPVDLVWSVDGKRQRTLLCQVTNGRQLGWTVVVAGPVNGLRMVDGLKTFRGCWRYALNVRTDIEGTNY